MTSGHEPESTDAPAAHESTEDLIGRRGSPVISSDGKRIGEIEEIFEDAATGTPEWIGLGSGVLFAHRVLVPITDAAVDDDGIHTVRHTKEIVKGSPEVEIVDDEFLSSASERTLREYYGLRPPDRAATAPRLRIRRYVQEESAAPLEDPGQANTR